LAQYIAIALSADIESDIADKQANSFLLTPFESTFQNCGINLVSREAVVKNLIEEIYAGIYPDVDALQYNDIRFGDCIIPFPDTRRGSSVIADSFPSNKLIAESL